MFLPKKKRKNPNLDVRTEEGFTNIYEHYVEYVFSICHRYLGDVPLSEDITSKIFTSLWERREELCKQTWQEDSWRRYLAKAVKHKVYDHYKSREQSDKYKSTVIRELYPSGNTTEEQIHYGELSQQMSQLIKELPPKCKEVFLMSRDVGLSHREIAERLSISQNAIKKHVNKALQHLRQHLTDYSLPNRPTGS